MSLVIRKYADLSEPLFFYNGTERLRFSKQNWLYLWEKPTGLVPLKGVTSTCHIIDRSAALMPWAVKMALKRTWEKLQDYRRADGFFEIYFTELESILEDARKADKDALEDAGDVGHIAHDWIENYIKSVLSGNENRTLELLAKLPEDERAANCCIAALEWMAKHNVRWQATEQRVFSRQYGFAGTLDGLALIDSCDDPLCCPHAFKDRLSITDWKTSNYLYVEYLLQTAAYWQAVYEEKRTPIEDRWIIRLGKEDAEFDPWHAPGKDLFVQDFTAFLHCLNLSLTLDTINGRISDIKAARKEFKKKQREAEKAERMKVRCDKADDYKGKRMTKCLTDGTQCQACAEIYRRVHEPSKEGSSTQGTQQSSEAKES